jgi:hypothetical protein
MLKGMVYERGEPPMFERLRYVLIHVLSDGTPNAVQPVSSLDEAYRKLKALTEREGGGWHIFDLKENRRLDFPRSKGDK